MRSLEKFIVEIGDPGWALSLYVYDGRIVAPVLLFYVAKQ